MFDPGDSTQYKPFGESDERFSIVGGNQKLADVLAARLGNQIHTEHYLKAISQNSKRYILTFGIGSSSSTDVEADMVLLTIPFTTLREVDIRIPLPEPKMNAIRNLGYGTNSKVFVGVNDRVWRNAGYVGYAFSDNGMMTGYDHTQMQTSNAGPGGYTVYLGGKAGIECGTPSLEELQKQFVPAVDQVFPGIIGSFNGRFQRWHWPSYVFSKCSYVSFKTGQYTTLSGAIQKPVDHLFFAGEHCSYEFQGFMNGAAKTGREAAEAIIQKLKG
jgi:monoamine oxidase